jgi:hypothetical protein
MPWNFSGNLTSCPATLLGKDIVENVGKNGVTSTSRFKNL